MKVVIAIDSFKGSLSSLEVGTAIKKGILKSIPLADVTIIPLADGGEGTIEAFTYHNDAKLVNLFSVDAYQNKILSQYAIYDNVAIIEVAKTIGLPLVKNALNPLKATSYGVGIQINDALNKGIKNFVIGLGGSATNDAGLGMLSALGYKFYDQSNNLVNPLPCNLKNIFKIDDSEVNPLLKEAKFEIASDVKNPLTGPNGATFVYGKQKGVKPTFEQDLDNDILHFANVASDYLAHDYKDEAGSGAAGGLGFAFKAFLKANIKEGIYLILDKIHFKDIIKDADIVITGEGRLDRQTVNGKAPIGVAKIAKSLAKKVILLAGGIDDELDSYNSYGIDAYFSIIRNITTLENALNKDNAFNNISKTSEQIFNLIKTMKGDN